MRKPRARPTADTIQLEGPGNPTLTPPPQRRTGAMVAVGIFAVALLGAAGVIVTRPEFVSVVRAFAGGV